MLPTEFKLFKDISSAVPCFFFASSSKSCIITLHPQSVVSPFSFGTLLHRKIIQTCIWYKPLLFLIVCIQQICITSTCESSFILWISSSFRCCVVISFRLIYLLCHLLWFPNSLSLLCPPLVWGLAGALVVRPIHLALGRVSFSLPCAWNPVSSWYSFLV